MPFNSATTRLASADRTNDMVGFAAAWALHDMRGGLVGRVSFAAVFLHNWSFASAAFAAGIGVTSRTGHTSHSEGL